MEEDKGKRTRQFQILLKRAQRGSQEAARELYETYVQYVYKCVKARMWRKLRARFDSQDFVQQVWASFFIHGNRLPDFQTPEELIGFLQTMAQRKVLGEGRRQHTQKWNVRREQRVDENASSVGRNPAGHEPTPSAIAVYHEQYDRLVERQEPEVREVAELRVAGNTFPEIAASLEMDESTARRYMRQLRRRVEAEEGDVK